jgi:hypothetical protein
MNILILFENLVLEKVLESSPVIGLYPATKESSLVDFEAWKKNNFI